MPGRWLPHSLRCLSRAIRALAGLRVGRGSHGGQYTGLDRGARPRRASGGSASRLRNASGPGSPPPKTPRLPIRRVDLNTAKVRGVCLPRRQASPRSREAPSTMLHSSAQTPLGRIPCRLIRFMSQTAATGWMKYVASYSCSLKSSMCSSPVGRTRSSWSVQAVRAPAIGWARFAEWVMTCQRGDAPPRSRLLGPVSLSHPTARHSLLMSRRCAEPAEKRTGS